MIESICMWNTQSTMSQNPIWLPRVMIAHLDHEVRSSLKRSLERVGFVIFDCENANEFDRKIAACTSGVTAVDLVICDAELLNGRSLDLVARRQKDNSLPPLIIMMHRHHRRRELLYRLRVAAIFEEPFAMSAQLGRIRKLCDTGGKRKPELSD